MRLLAALLVLAVTGLAGAEDDDAKPDERPGEQPTGEKSAQPQPTKPQLTKPADERTAAEVEDAPPPGGESGRIDAGERDSPLRDVAQGVLLVPRLVIEGTFAPVRGGLWVYERYGVGTRLKRLTFDDTNTYGLYPMLYVNTDYGATFGGRFVHRNLLGAREKLALRGALGGEFNELVEGTLSTGERLGGGTSLEISGEHERRPRDPFYGVGNMDNAIEVRHRQQLRRVAGILDVPVNDELHVRFSGALTDLEYGVAGEGPPIDMTYGDMLTGWSGTRNLYGELELRYDTREVTNDLAHHGVLLEAFTGRIHQVEAGNDYWRYGGEAIHFLPLGVGRSLATRLRLEAVTGSVQDVAFTQLPQLGGTTLLRGYAQDRFRDRIAVLGATEYFWDVSRFLLASLFVDAGRVYGALDEVAFDDVRVGYGASLQLLNARRFFAGLSVASSIDGGLFVNLVLDPVYEPEPRVRHR
jgi:hypothetical protein